MTVTLNIIATALIAGLAAAGAAVSAAGNPTVGGILAGAAAVLKLVDGMLTHAAVSK